MPAQIKLPEQNLVLLVGRLTRDPNVAFTQKGQAVCRCSIAVNRRYLDKTTNEWKDDVVYVPIVIWGAAADRCKDRLKKGTPISVEGRLTPDEYTDKNTGQVRKSLQVTATRVQILEFGAAGASGYEEGVSPAVKDDVPTTDVAEDDVPF